MTRLTDGKKTVEITMQTWTGDGYTPDWSYDFFEVGALKRDEDAEAYIVRDVDYCVEMAIDWKNGVGDFYNELDTDVDDRTVDVEYK